MSAFGRRENRDVDSVHVEGFYLETSLFNSGASCEAGSFIFFFLIDFGGREKHRFVVPFTYVFSCSLLQVP